MNDPTKAIIAVSFFTTAAYTIRSIASIWAANLQSKNQPRELRSSVEERLERIEAAVDVIAVEVERMAESQRFLAKLNSAAPRSPGVTTPH